MKIRELLMESCEKGRLFKATGPDGQDVLLCRDLFIFASERTELLARHPDIYEWEVTVENIKH
jgi:hypothetical protein